MIGGDNDGDVHLRLVIGSLTSDFFFFFPFSYLLANEPPSRAYSRWLGSSKRPMPCYLLAGWEWVGGMMTISMISIRLSLLWCIHACRVRPTHLPAFAFGMQTSWKTTGSHAESAAKIFPPQWHKYLSYHIIHPSSISILDLHLDFAASPPTGEVRVWTNCHNPDYRVQNYRVSADHSVKLIPMNK